MSNCQNTYNLLHEPWIKCSLIDGSVAEFGLIEFNKRVNKISNIHEPTLAGNNFPFYELALYRFLNVLYSRALNWSPWEDIDSTVGLNEEEIDIVHRYLLDHESRFDVLSRNYPFMQCVNSDMQQIEMTAEPNKTSFVTSFVHLPSENALKTNTLLGYNLNVAPGNTKQLISQIASDIAITPKEAVYHLLYLNSFVKCAGVAGCSSISSTPELYVLFRGETIGQTIKMNLITDAQSYSKPMWERDSILTYYNAAETIDCIGYTFYPNRLCRFEWESGKSNRLLYAPHDFKTLNTTSKEICKSNCEIFYQGHDRDALIRIVEDKPICMKYNRTENWLTLLMSAIINDGEIPTSSIAGRNLFSGSVVLPDKITISLYGRSADGKSGVYQYAEKLEESTQSDLFADPIKRAYIEKYIQCVKSQFVISKNIVKKYYQLKNAVNPHVENKVPFINQCISTYSHQRLYDLCEILNDGVDIESRFDGMLLDIKHYTKNAVLDMLSEDILVATQAYSLIVFGGKK